jgi:hypothetical protein
MNPGGWAPYGRWLARAMHRGRAQPELEAMMNVRSLVLMALVLGLSFGGMRESHAITSCNVCADEEHLCKFQCYVGTPPFQTTTTCKGAGYKCVRTLGATSDEACSAAASTVAALEPVDAVTRAIDWVRDGYALVSGIVDRVASLESEVGARLAHA